MPTSSSSTRSTSARRHRRWRSSAIAWKTCTRTHVPSIDKIAVARGEHQRQLSAIGPSLSGWVYGDAASGLFARAVPVAELRLAARRDYERHVAVNRAACGTVFQARQDV